MMKKAIFFALVCASVMFMACSSKSDRTELDQDELVAYDALSIAEEKLSDEIQGMAAATAMRSGRSVATATTESGSISGDVGGTADYTGSVSYDDVSGIYTFSGTFTFNDYSFTDGADTYVVTGAETYGFTMNMTSAAMETTAKGKVAIGINGKSVTLDFDYAIKIVEDATAREGYRYEVSGSINGVAVEDIMAQYEDEA